ncbi:hypothetical protein, partial [Rhodopirellula islandica]|uniref:hypothetical protein n=1 Tax=Rhodopirellula islandica TaxID=595434 RepID=UPI0006492C0B
PRRRQPGLWERSKTGATASNPSSAQRSVRPCPAQFTKWLAPYEFYFTKWLAPYEFVLYEFPYPMTLDVIPLTTL